MRAHRLQSYVLAILMLCAGALRLTAQTADPNTERGVTPGKAYAAGEPDTINLFNGNLNMTIPIGQSYKVGGDFSYGLALSYGGNSWEHGTRIYETWFPGQSESGYRTFTYSWSFPSRRSNAGLGWMLSLGRLYSKYGCGFAGGCFTAYESPDGALHSIVTPTLHDLDANEHAYPNQNAPTVYYSRDGTYLRYRKDNPEGLELDFPDGTITIFDWYTGMPTRRYDPHGNWLKVFYDDVNNPYCDPSTPHCASTWHLQDSQGRNHYVYFRPVASYYEFTSPAQQGQTPQSALVAHEAVAEVRLQTFGGTTSSYYFHYEGENFGAWPSIARQSIPGAGLDSAVGCTTPATLLTSVVLPDAAQSTYSMNYITTGPYGCVGTGWRDSGNIQKLTLPTGGRIEWTYQQYAFNNPAIVEDFNLGASGVATRTIFDAANTPLSLTKYEPTLNREAGTPPPESQTVVTVSSGDGTETFSKKIHYFSTCVNTRGGGQCAYPTGEYGLPFTRVPRSGNPDSSGTRFLSTVELTRDAAGGWNGPQRKSYIRYEADAPLTSSKVLDRNRRPASQRTVYEDGKIADDDSSVFDGLGHYRQQATGGNFGRADSRTLFTNHNPTVGTFTIVNGAVSGFTMIPVSSRWLLSTFTFSTVTETLPGNSTPTTSATQYCFDSTTGYLKRTRLIKAAATGANPSSLPLGSTDVLAVFTPNSNGNTIREQYLGGDNGPAPSITDTCNSTISSEAFRIDHTFQYGSMATAQYYDQYGSALSFKSLDTDIDANTGLVKTSRDRGDIYNNYLNTDFTYDALGRLTDVQPMAGISGTWTHFDYTMNPPKVDTYHRQHGATSGYLAHAATQFDVLGRPWRESRTMPDGSNSVRETLYNGAGWKASVSEAEATPTHRTYFVYDSFGRPTKVTAPDNSVVTMTYNGVTSMTKTVGVRTAGDATNITISSSSTTESYDRQGRLWKVTDPWNIVTEYTYDIGDRLTQVCMNKQGTLCAQIRSFVYDNRGFLGSETHPEKGKFGNGTTQYFDYDARGHATRRLDGVVNGKFDLLYEYDRAERLKRIGYRSGRPLKVFTYGTDNDVVNGDWRNGKLTRALRYNWMDAVSYGVQVSEDYTYAGKDGRVSKRNTTDFECLVTPTTPCTDYGTGQVSRSFSQTFGYDDLGQTTSLGYPACTFMGCQGIAPAAPVVSNTFTNGFLTSVNWTGSPRASTISYWPNGLVNQVAHGNYVTDTQALDPDGMERPASISTTGAADAAACTAPTIASNPQSASLESGQVKQLSVTATADSNTSMHPVTYQWYANSGTQVGGNSNQLSVSTAGTYWVQVSNNCGSVSSAAAVVSACEKPVIITGPQNATITQGDTATLTVNATGTNLDYHWYIQISAFSFPVGENSSTFKVAPMGSRSYWVQVTNDCGFASSYNASVTVIPPPSAPTLLATGTGFYGVNLSWTTPATTGSGIDHYEIQRLYNGTGFTTIMTFGANVHSTADNNVNPVIAYVYRVRAVDTSGIASPWSEPDLATTVSYAYDPIAYGTPVSSTLIGQLRQTIDAIRRTANLTQMWSSYGGPTGIVQGSVVMEMREALNDARSALALAPIAYEYPSVGAGNPMNRSDLGDIQGGTK